jgi:DNA-binding YbaB/EbfC family protein
MAEEPSMMQMLKQARVMQKQMKTIQKKVDKKEVSTTAADGKIEVVITGKLEIRRILIDQALLENPDKLALQNGLTKAVNDAIRKAQNLMSTEMQKMAGDMGIPPDALGEAMGGGDDDQADDTTGGDDASTGGRFKKWFGR